MSCTSCESAWPESDALAFVEDICRFPAALAAIIAAKGAKVEHLDNRQGRRRSCKTQPYEPPRIEAVEELMQARFERFEQEAAAGARGRNPCRNRSPASFKKRSRVAQ